MAVTAAIEAGLAAGTVRFIRGQAAAPVPGATDFAESSRRQWRSSPFRRGGRERPHRGANAAAGIPPGWSAPAEKGARPDAAGGRLWGAQAGRLAFADAQ